MKITFIGGGNMGEAMLSAILRQQLSTPREIIVSDAAAPRRQYLKEKYGVNVTGDNTAAVKSAEVIVLAVKPQTLPAVLAELKGQIRERRLVLSIVAGARMATLRNGLLHNTIARSMPNTPAQIGLGMTVWTAAPAVSQRQKTTVGKILGALGQQICFTDEKYLDMATAVSGSGPAYLFYFVESFIEAAAAIGFSRKDAKILAMQTINGATQLLAQSGKEAAELRQAVTSPGGTTAAALKTLEEGKFKELITSAVKSAHARAKELGK